ncbi:MAG: extracellular solute-binding protein [Bacteroidales bacterium]
MKKLLLVLLVLGLAGLLYAGGAKEVGDAAAAKTDNEGIALESYTDEMKLDVYYAGGCNPAATAENLMTEYIMDRFKINLEDVSWPAGENSENKINMMVASGAMPDVVQYWSQPTVFHRLADADMLTPLDDLIDMHMPNYKKYVNDEILDVFRNPKDGKLYILPSFTLIPENIDKLVKINGVPVVRKDMLEKTGMDLPETPEELYVLLKKIKQVGGPDIIPYSNIHPNNELHLTLGSMFGYPPYGVEIDHEAEQIVSLWHIPEYLEFLKYASKLFREGLINPEILISNFEQNIEKAKEGRFAVTFVAPEWVTKWFYPVWNQKGIDTEYVPFTMPKKEGVDNTYYIAYDPFGWSMSCISKEVENPARIAKFIDWMYTKEGNMIMWWGPPSKEKNVWYMENDEIYYNEVVDKKVKNGEMALNVGGWSYWTNLPGWYDDINPTVIGKGAPGVDPFLEECQESNINEAYADINFARYSKAEKGPIYKERWQDVENLVDKWEADIIMRAKNDAQVEEKYNQMLKELKDAGLIQIEKENYQIYIEVNSD